MIILYFHLEGNKTDFATINVADHGGDVDKIAASLVAAFSQASLNAPSSSVWIVPGSEA